MISFETELHREWGELQKCFTSKLCLFNVTLFPLLKYLVKTSMALKKHFNPRGGGAQSKGFGLVLLCNSTKTVLAKTCGLTFCV